MKIHETRETGLLRYLFEQNVIVNVQQLYFLILITRQQKQAAELRIAALEQQLRDAQQAVEAGNILPVAEVETGMARSSNTAWVCASLREHELSCNSRFWISWGSRISGVHLRWAL